MSATGNLNRRLGWTLFLFLCCVYLVTSGGHFYTGDGIEMFKTAKSLVTHGDLVVRPGPTGRVWGYTGADGRQYSPYALGLSLLEAPAYAAARAAVAFLPAGEVVKEKMAQAAAVSVNVFVTAATALLVFLILSGESFSRRASAGTAVLYGLGTMAWVYSKHDFAEPLAAFCLLASARFVILAGKEGRAGALLLAGAFNGYSFFTKYQMVLYTPLLILLLLQPLRESSRSLGRAARKVAIFMFPGLLFGLANLYVNHLRFGAWLETGYGKQGAVFAGVGFVPEGLYGLLLSPGKGLFWYSPLVLAVPFAWRRFHARSPRLSWLACGVTVLTLAIFAPLWWWHGDWAWGPRYLMVALPFLVLPIAALIEDAPLLARRVLRGVRIKHLLAAVVAAALIVNALGLAVNFLPYLQALKNLGKVNDDWNFIPNLSPLRFHAHVILGWAVSSLGGDPADYHYLAWSDGKMRDEVIHVAGISRAAGGPDFFFFKPRDTLVERVLLTGAGLAMLLGACLLGWKLRAALAAPGS